MFKINDKVQIEYCHVCDLVNIKKNKYLSKTSLIHGVVSSIVEQKIQVSKRKHKIINVYKVSFDEEYFGDGTFEENYLKEISNFLFQEEDLTLSESIDYDFKELEEVIENTLKSIHKNLDKDSLTKIHYNLRHLQSIIEDVNYDITCNKLGWSSSSLNC
jgi:hypothetical protein